ncbi:MAG TPA: M20 family metallopeptidase [Pyrinomonadaceae bacterium]|jgi:glutamate carboxypeptidase|nr:M20 family metallopeptidase [Pyrinomonadaceae bacterium]
MELSTANIAALNDYFVGRREAVIAFTRALVEAESPSGDEAGSKAVVSLLAAAAEAVSGVIKIERVASDNYGEHLRLRALSDSPKTKPLLILGHTDTVHPRGSLRQRPWRVAGNRAYGPGVFDMKANCALALEAIRACVETGIRPQRPVVLLLTCDEETGSLTGRQLVEAQARNAHAVLVLEPPASGGRCKTGRKGTGMFSLEAHGRAAHAGLEPEKGASAILELARQTDRLHALNGKGGGISVNVGVFQGGTLSNVIAARARAEIDVRFSTTEEAAFVESEILNLRPIDDRVQLLVKGGINRPPLERSAKVLNLYNHARHIAVQLNFELGETQVGGASDGNFAAAVGAPVLDGLGIAGDGAHATHEHILIDDIPRRGALLAALISTL